MTKHAGKCGSSDTRTQAIQILADELARLTRELEGAQHNGKAWHASYEAEYKAKTQAEQRAEALERALQKARTFIEYARYELADGKAQLGDQFPKKDDADEAIAQIDSALSSPSAGPDATGGA